MFMDYGRLHKVKKSSYMWIAKSATLVLEEGEYGQAKGDTDASILSFHTTSDKLEFSSGKHHHIKRKLA